MKFSLKEIANRPLNRKLALIGFASQCLNYPNNFAFDPSGKWLYAVNMRGNNIAQFNIDAETDELKLTAMRLL